ncbi:TonB-dependent receptor [Pontibacter burrus]|uniref:TonB-dependent receptor n=1 Tax=Pontibacter burrus TaxID=2704466 RepID=A0A6B3LSV1_9BACT|nr:TonB-dependent receptor [Pontibacter burrus]NEM96540.1 TonB-dependent receptor [Pontibacter burrus]
MFIDKNLQKLLLLPFLLFVQPLVAQQMLQPELRPEVKQDCGLTISGKVLDHDTRTALPGATIYIPQLDRAAIADAYGNYHFHHLCQGNYTLKVSFIGYTTETYSLRITTSTVRDLQLHSDAAMLRSIEVVSTKIIAESQSTEVLKGRQLQQTEGLALGRALEKLPGVSSLQTGPNVSKPVIHGLSGSRVLILNNGVRHEAQQWGDEHAPEIDALAATELKVVKGAAGVRYGSDAIAGTILVNPSPMPDTVGVSGNVSLIGNTNGRMGTIAGMVQGKLQHLPISWRLNSSIKKAGDSHTPDYILKNTGFEEQNLSAAVAYNREKFGAEAYYSLFHSKTGILTSAHVGARDDLLNAIERGRPEETGSFSYNIDRPYQDVSHHLLKLKGYYTTGDLGKLLFTYAFQQNAREEFDKDAPRHAPEAPELHLDLITHTTELVWEHELPSAVSGSLGVSTIWQNNTYEGRQFIPFYKNFTAGVFAEEKWRSGNLQLEAGARYDFKDLRVKNLDRYNTLSKPTYKFHNLSGSVGALLDVGYHFTFGTNLSYASRAPHPNELFADGIHHGTASFERGDPDLTSEHALNLSATLNYHTNPRLNGGISLFYNNIYNYIYLQPAREPMLTIKGNYLAYFYKQTDARFYGADLYLTYDLTSQLHLNTKAAIVKALNTETENTENSKYLPGIPADRISADLQYDFNDHTNSGLSDSFVSVGGLMVARQSRSDSFTDPNMPAPEGYFLLNAEAGTTLKIGRQPVILSVSGNNLLNTVYRDYQNRMRYFAAETARMLLIRINLPLVLKQAS